MNDSNQITNFPDSPWVSQTFAHYQNLPPAPFEKSDEIVQDRPFKLFAHLSTRKDYF